MVYLTWIGLQILDMICNISSIYKAFEKSMKTADDVNLLMQCMDALMIFQIEQKHEIKILCKYFL